MRVIPQEIIDRIREATDIIDVVSRHVTLKPSGKYLKGLCPFHKEKTPSFTVSQDRQRFHCFGCGADGNVYDFMMRVQGLTFMEALKTLSEATHIPLPDSDSSAQDREAEKIRRQILGLTAWAAGFFQQQLNERTGRGALAYLKRRGIDPHTAEVFGIGLAPAGWDRLLQAAVKEGYSPERIEQAGLILRKSSGSGYYDRFRGRLMFPIHDPQGRPVAFGGRLLGPGEPKYLNSPETPIFTKGDVLYGLHRAREAGQKEKRLVLVEGYMDVIACHAAGVQEAVASLGTALTPNQARLVRRVASTVCLLYDMDDAGVAASKRAFEVLSQEELTVRVATTPGVKDPDEYVRKHGAEALRQRVSASRPFMEFALDTAGSRHDPDTIDGKQAIVDEVAPFWRRLTNPIESAEYQRILAERLRLDLPVVASALARSSKGVTVRMAPAPPEPATPQAPKGVPAPLEEEMILAFLLRYPSLIERIRPEWVPGQFQPGPLRDLAEQILAAPAADPEAEEEWLTDFLAAQQGTESGRLAQALSRSAADAADPERVVKDCLKRLEGARLQDLARDFQQRIAVAQREGDMEAFKQLAQEKTQVDARLNSLGLAWKPRLKKKPPPSAAG